MGLIDEVAIHAVALSAREILGAHERGVPTDESGLDRRLDVPVGKVTYETGPSSDPGWTELPSGSVTVPLPTRNEGADAPRSLSSVAETIFSAQRPYRPCWHLLASQELRSALRAFSWTADTRATVGCRIQAEKTLTNRCLRCRLTPQRDESRIA